MSLLRDAPKDEDQLSGDVVVSMTEKPAGVAGESVVATVGTAAAVAKCRQVLDIKMISKGQADGPLRPCDLISEGVERQDVNPAARGYAPLDRLSPDLVRDADPMEDLEEPQGVAFGVGLAVVVASSGRLGFVPDETEVLRLVSEALSEVSAAGGGVGVVGVCRLRRFRQREAAELDDH